MMTNLEYIRKTYGVPAKRGMMISVYGDDGCITGANCNGHLLVKFLGFSFSSPCHQTWRVKYYDNEGKLLAEYGD